MLEVKKAALAQLVLICLVMKNIEALEVDCSIVSAPEPVNTTRNCNVTLYCETSTSYCNLEIMVLYEDDNNNATDIDDTYCTNTEWYKECTLPFVTSCEVWCRAPGYAESDHAEIRVLEHLDVVEIHKSSSEYAYFLWEQPHTDEGIELEYNIIFMYKNGTTIQNITQSNQSEYHLPSNVNECELVVLTVIAKTSCGDVSSNSSSWSGSILKPARIPESEFNVVLRQVKDGVSTAICYTMNISCPSARALSANLSCYYEIRKSRENYKLAIMILEGGQHVCLVDNDRSNESVVLKPNEEAQCKLTLINENGETEQWIQPKNFSTFSVQHFNFTKINKTHICMEFFFLQGLLPKECQVKLTNKNNKAYILELKKINEENVHKCFMRHSVPNGHYQYCVTVDGQNCSFQSCCVNITGGGSAANQGLSVQTILVITIPITFIVVVILVALVIVIEEVYRRKYRRNKGNIEDIELKNMQQNQDEHYKSLTDTPSTALAGNPAKNEEATQELVNEPHQYHGNIDGQDELVMISGKHPPQSTDEVSTVDSGSDQPLLKKVYDSYGTAPSTAEHDDKPSYVSGQLEKKNSSHE